jgi:hypothetical protein
MQFSTEPTGLSDLNPEHAREHATEPAAEGAMAPGQVALEQAAMEEAEAEAAMMPPTAATPPSPVMDAPTPPRPALVSEDTKTFDRGRRRREGLTALAMGYISNVWFAY